MGGRIVILADNTAGGPGLLAEHGWAVWIERDRRRVLFDTGAGAVLPANARRLGVPAASVEAIALSHGHYDHTAGLGDLLAADGPRRLYAHAAAFGPRFSRDRAGIVREIGMPGPGEQAAYARAEVVGCTGPTDLGDGLHLTGPIPRRTGFEDTGGAFYLDRGCTLPDELPDDQAAFIDTRDGTVVVLGCAHAGVANTLRYIAELTDGRPIHTVLGGMHLINAGRERIHRTVLELRALDVRRLMPAHCTGPGATARLWREFPGRCAPCATGTIVSLDA